MDEATISLFHELLLSFQKNTDNTRIVTSDLYRQNVKIHDKYVTNGNKVHPRKLANSRKG